MGAAGCWVCNYLPRLSRVLIGFFSRHQTKRCSCLSPGMRGGWRSIMRWPTAGQFMRRLWSLTGQAGRRSRKKTKAEESTTEVRIGKLGEKKRERKEDGTNAPQRDSRLRRMMGRMER